MPEYAACVEIVRRDLVTATAAASGVATLLMGLLANMPLGLAPGMGINAYFTYQVVGFAGSGGVSYDTALFAVFIEGIIFLVLALTGLRMAVVRTLPSHIKLATPVGIGLFLAHIGLQSSEGLGIVVADGATKVALGGCGHYNEVCDEFGQFCTCTTDKMRGATVWLGITGFLMVMILLLYRVKGAMIFGILFVTFVSWPRGDSKVTFFPDDDIGDERFAFFKKVVSVEGIQKTAGVLFDNVDLGSGRVWEALITFLYVDILDTTGTLYSMASVLGLVDEKGDFPRQTRAFSCDAIGVILGSLLGTPPVSTYIESGAGIKEGGRTGVTAVVIAACFFLAIFFAPLLASIPPWATGGALVVVGALMASEVSNINWSDMRQAFPAFVTIALMPLTYSIAYGLIAGIGTAIIIGVFEVLFGCFGLKMAPQEPLHPWAVWIRAKVHTWAAWIWAKLRRRDPDAPLKVVDDSAHRQLPKGAAQEAALPPPQV